jgi:hypothetical protein
VLGVAPDELEAEVDRLHARAKTSSAQLRVDSALRERARTGRYAYVHDRGADFAAGILEVDPVFMLDAAHQALADEKSSAPAADPAYFAAAGLDAPDLRDAIAADREQRQRHAEAGVPISTSASSSSGRRRAR